MAMTKSPHNIFLPADGVALNLHTIPSYYFLRIHEPTGHVYLDHFTESHGVERAAFDRQVPTRVEAARLKELVTKWGMQQPGTWNYELCSLGDVADIVRAEKMKRNGAAQAVEIPAT